jgi:predicted secreted protein
MRDYRNPAEIIQEQIGNHFNITLESLAASSGFTWNAVYDPTFLREVKPKEYIQRLATVGTAIDERFEFETIKPGKVSIAMIYQREWKPIPQDSKTFNLSILE